MDSDSEAESLLGSEESEFCSSSGSESEEDSPLSAVRDWCKLNPLQMPPPPPPFPFTGNAGLKVLVSDAEDPLEYFQLFFDNDILSYIAQETNRYASEFFEYADLTPSSRALKWKETDSNEVKRFLALLLLQGVVQKPVEKFFWSKRPILCTPFFGSVMSQPRYGLLMKFIHFEDSSSFDANSHPHPKLRKIYDIQSKLVTKFQDVYTPEKNVSIDESLMAYKGRLSWKQFIPSKRSRFGIKLYQLCESESGYIWNSLIYTGKQTVFEKEYEEFGSSTKSVMTLMKDLFDKGYSLTTDNFYTSPELAELLIKKKTDLCGTMRSNRKNLPVELRNQKLKKGEVIAFQKGKICALKWKDKKEICLISTTHNSSMVELTNKRKEKIMKPLVVVHYNNNMGGVDKSDQCLSYYPVMRNKQRKYYKKIFRHLLNQAVWNSFVLYKKQLGPLTHLDFRLKLIERLIEESSPIQQALPRGIVPKTSENVIRLTGRHFPSHVPDKETRKRPSRKCVVCAMKTNENGKRVRRETRIECADCNVGLCVVPCFKLYHTVLEL